MPLSNQGQRNTKLPHTFTENSATFWRSSNYADIHSIACDPLEVFSALLTTVVVNVVLTILYFLAFYSISRYASSLKEH